MLSLRTLAVAVASFVTLQAWGQADPVVFSATSETTDRYNPGSAYTLYQGVYMHAPGATQARINSITVGIRRTGIVSAPAPAVTAEISIREMTWNGLSAGLGDVVATQAVQLTSTTATTTAQYTVSWGDADPALRPIVDLQTLTDGANGYGAFWVGLRFTGSNANSTANSWRIVNVPGAPTQANPLATGRCLNSFGLLNTDNGTWGPNFTRGQTTGTDGVSRDNPCRFMMVVRGAPIDPGSTAPDLLLGQTCSDPDRYVAPLATSQSGTDWVLGSAFVPAAPGKWIKPRSVRVGLSRRGSPAEPAPATAIEIALLQMTWNNGIYGYNPVIAANLTTSLAAIGSVSTQMVQWDFPPEAAPVYLPLETESVDGRGGLWIAARMIGPTASSDRNAFGLGYAPVTGESFNSFLRVQDDGTVTVVTAGNYSNSTTSNPQPKPSRLLLEISGEIVDPPPPCAADFNLDGSVTGADLGLLLGAWGPCGPEPCFADLNLDGSVTGADLGLLLGAWGACP